MKKAIITLIFLLLSSHSYANSNFSATGKIIELYASESGGIAIRLNTYSKYDSQAKTACPGYNGWTGNTNADPILKSALLAAKASQTTVRISVRGCDAGGAWAKAASVYMLNN